ncbi:dienelactone hydrolase family protein [Curvibacter sp. CHRR-16]|uniref:dienelactone hydrolase family protein n=1 Tax=Curvibacter sp. CHRR-16 TaxID=2835872 RepID=UPI001BD9835D|nr:dienelactone hydrolase family protein [Curvibacter sp. CHRR-16]MBT0571021.1 dienelactone hydrolase family protein [Curvibacter sp. CHRR-16]
MPSSFTLLRCVHWTLWLWLCSITAMAEPLSHSVQIASAPLSSAPQALRGTLYWPDNHDASTPPIPAVVMLHGCGGAYTSQGKVSTRFAMWGQLLAQHGYAALLVDSFGPRGLREICTTALAKRTLKEADRVGDAYAALQYLRQQPGIDTQHIGLMGWSNGAGVTLDAIRHKPQGVAGFQAAVAFYPGCTARNRKADSFMPYAPLHIFIGQADDWTPAAPCIALTHTAQSHGAPMQIVTYPDTYHDFDNPTLTAKRLRTDVPNGVNPGQGTTIAPNPQARADAQARTLAFLQEFLYSR